MKNQFANQADKAINAATAVAILIFAGALIALVVFPAPSMASVKKSHIVDRKRVDQSIQDAGKKAKEQETTNGVLLWSASLESIGPSALSKITLMAKSHQVKLSSFRPQRTGDVDGLTMVPFLMNVDGSYPNVVAFVKDIESTGSKLAVNQVQMSSVDGVSDKVSASVGIVAYMKAGDALTNG